MRYKRLFSLRAAVFIVLLLAVTSAMAQIAPRATNRQIQTLLTRIETRTDSFRTEMERPVNRNRVNNATFQDIFARYISEFERSTNELRQEFNQRQTVNNEVTEVLNNALPINEIMAQYQLTASAESQWRNLRTDLNTLANYYRVAWNWNRRAPGFPNDNFPTGSFDSRITGTYRLNSGLSDNVSAVVDRSVNLYNANQRERVRRNLERRLGSPDMLAIEKINRQVSIASTLAPQVTFTADGIARSETTNRGRTIRTTATANREDVTINTTGDRMNDFTVTFAPTRDGRLRITRRIYLENRSETVTVASVYDKTDQIARWSTVNSGPTWGDNTGSAGDFLVPNGTRINARLNNLITTRESQAGDRFTMEVTSPARYRGAIIEGRVAQADGSGRVSGRANVSLEFDSIRWNGRSYRFAGIIETVRTANGDNVSINNEGAVRDGSQTTRTVTRAGIGAALGALIGAIVGGGEGAAIGAGVGAGAGAGTILIQGRDNLELGQGSEFGITATAPTNVGRF